MSFHFHDYNYTYVALFTALCNYISEKQVYQLVYHVAILKDKNTITVFLYGYVLAHSDELLVYFHCTCDIHVYSYYNTICFT